MQLRTLLTSSLALAAVGFAGHAFAQVCTSVPAGTIAGNVTWCDNEDVMVLEGAVRVTGNLTINAGCIVRGQPRNQAFVAFPDANEPGSLQIEQGGFLDARGTAQNPIIFTTAAVDVDGGADGIPDPNPAFPRFLRDWVPADGCGANFYDDDPRNQPLAPLNVAGGENLALWGGLILTGYAPTNLGNADGVGEGRGILEGTPDLIFGGDRQHDSSGILEYISIRHGGDDIAEGNEINGLTVGAAGDGTVCNNIEVYANEDDGVEWFGGTMSCRNLLMAFVGDDSTDQDEGYNGTNQNVLVLSTFFNQDNGDAYGAESGDSGGEWDGDDCFGNCRALPRTNSSMCNYTFLGNGGDGAANPANSPAAGNDAWDADTAWGGAIVNSIVVNTNGGLPADINAGGFLPPSCSDLPGPAAGDRVAGTTVGVWDRDEELYMVATTAADTVAVTACETEATFNGDSWAAALNANGANPPVGTNRGYGPLIGNELLVNENTYFPPRGTTVGGRGKLVAGVTKPVSADPRPADPVGDAALVGGGIDPRLVGCPDGSATYRGATPASQPLFTDGWTAMDAGGIL